MSRQIVSVCGVLADIPIVRYKKFHSQVRPIEFAQSAVFKISDDGAGAAGAVRLQHGILASWFLQFKLAGNRGTLVILDRSFDPLTPLLHEFSYQAMANDLLPIEKGCVYSYLLCLNRYKMSIGSESKIREVILDETDSVWVDLRHIHIAECISNIIESFNKFIQENKASKFEFKVYGADLRQLKMRKREILQFPPWQK